MTPEELHEKIATMAVLRWLQSPEGVEALEKANILPNARTGLRGRVELAVACCSDTDVQDAWMVADQDKVISGLSQEFDELEYQRLLGIWRPG